MTLGVMRMLQLAANRDNIRTIEAKVSADVAYQLLNRKRHDIYQLEQQTGKTIIVRADSHVGLDQAEFDCLDAQGQPVKFLSVSPGTK